MLETGVSIGLDTDQNNSKLCYINQENIRIIKEVNDNPLSDQISLKNLADNYFGLPLQDAVIAVPSHWTSNQRRKLLESDRNIKRIVNRTTAAAIAYSFQKNLSINILVLDCDNKDMSLLNIEEDIIEVVSISKFNPEQFESRDLPSIDQILLIGNPGMFFQIAKDHFMKDPILLSDSIAAQGAAIIASNSQEFKDMIVLDIASHSIKLETSGRELLSLIPKNSTTPVNKKLLFTTYMDSANGYSLRVFEGEGALNRDCCLLGTFGLCLQPAPRGSPRVEVTFNIDENGVFNLTAQEQGIIIPVKAEFP